MDEIEIESSKRFITKGWDDMSTNTVAMEL